MIGIPFCKHMLLFSAHISQLVLFSISSVEPELSVLTEKERILKCTQTVKTNTVYSKFEFEYVALSRGSAYGSMLLPMIFLNVIQKSLPILYQTVRILFHPL